MNSTGVIRTLMEWQKAGVDRYWTLSTPAANVIKLRLHDGPKALSREVIRNEVEMATCDLLTMLAAEAIMEIAQ